MTTERQLAANRANAKRSTGPKTKTGLLASSRNALRHGLAVSAGAAQTNLIDIAELTAALVDPVTDEAQIICAGQAARAHANLLRVRAARAKLLGLFVLKGCRIDDLGNVTTIDRYERVARGERRRAAAKLYDS